MACALVLLTTSTVFADPITSPTALSPGWTLIDFENIRSATTPLTMGGVTFFGQELDILNVSDRNLNGNAVESNILIDRFTAPIQIVFANPVSEFLLGWYDLNFPGNKLQAFNSANELLEETALPFNDGPYFNTFVGFKRNVADIAMVIALPVPPDPLVFRPRDEYGIDNVYFNSNVAAVPEPTSIELLGIAGLASLATMKKFKRVNPLSKH